MGSSVGSNHGLLNLRLLLFAVLSLMSYRLRDADVANADAAGIFSTYTCKWKIHNGKIKIISFSVKFSS
jgi:hypothetical protein